MTQSVPLGQTLGALLLFVGMAFLVVSWFMETYNYPDYHAYSEIREGCCGAASAIIALALLVCGLS